ncbi:uncharacterized protein IWZ02DRAFT_500822 [Phyllosticta citriasiana]|uniref:uncharacterized protein n=1 Tax=Phyllosticta citriasiana TaxID=595635 RepID=UPI0030FD248E
MPQQEANSRRWRVTEQPEYQHLMQILDLFTINGPNEQHQCFVFEAVVIRTGNLAFALPDMHQLGEKEFSAALGEIQTQEVKRKDDGPLRPGSPAYIVQPASFPEKNLSLLAQPAKIINFGEVFLRNDKSPEKLSVEVVTTIATIAQAPELFEVINGLRVFQLACETNREKMIEILDFIPDKVPERWQQQWQAMKSQKGSLDEDYDENVDREYNEPMAKMVHGHYFNMHHGYDADSFSEQDIEKVGKLTGKMEVNVSGR